MSQDVEYLKQFNRLYRAIHTETNRAALDRYLQKTERWRMDWLQETGNGPTIIPQLWSILYDEINRKKEQLRNKPGRQKAPDWFRKLDAHQKRLSNEFDVLQELQPGNRDINDGIALLSESMQFSLKLIAVDQSQIQKQNDAGYISISEEQALQLQSAAQLSAKATDFLKMQKAQ